MEQQTFEGLDQGIEAIVSDIAYDIRAKTTTWLSARSPDAFHQMELEIAAIGRSLADGVTGAILQALAMDGEFQAQASLAARKGVGRKVRHGGRRTVEVTLLGGHKVKVEVEYLKTNRRNQRGVRRGNGRRGKNGSGLYPVLSALGISWGVTPALADEICRHVADADSVRAARSALERRNIDLGHKETLRIVREFGGRAVAQRNEWLLGAAESPATTGILSGRRVVVAMDGGRIRERVSRRGRRNEVTRHHRYDAPWRETKLLAIYVIGDDGKIEDEFRPIYDGTMNDCDALFDMTLGYLKALGAHEAKEIIFVGDGAKWIWERTPVLIEELGISRERVTEAIDWYHAVETLHAVADARTRWPAGAREMWLARAKDALYAGNISALMQIFDEIALGRRATKINSHRDYFIRNSDRMRYNVFADSHIPLGSGSVESAIRRVVNMRMKGNGTFWRRDNAEVMLLLRSYLKAGRLDDLFRWSISRAASWWQGAADASNNPMGPIS